jgi:predicted ATPase
VGRAEAVAEVADRLTRHRLVTLTGPGGAGKTRLAGQVASQAGARFADGVWLAELAAVTDPAQVAAAVGAALGIRHLPAEAAADALARAVARRQLLLVLDNCEHVIGAAAELCARLLLAADDVRILATSREPLRIAGEARYRLGSLALPPSGDPAAAAECEAVTLFADRARQADPGFTLDADTVATVARLVTRLDGLPLAIELAAAKVRVMSAEEIDRRLEDRFALLRGGDRSAPDRHQALLTVIEWSWNLLSPAEQRALRRLALFHDGFTLEAAEAVLAEDAVDAVRGLVDQSLLTIRETPGGLRYRMLETVREYGQLQLARAGEEAGARAVQRRWAVGYVGAQQARVASASQVAAIDALAAEETNLADELRGAIADGDRESLVQLLAVLGLFWTMRGEHVRVLVLGDAVLEALRGWQPPPELGDMTRAAVAVTLNNTLMTGGASSVALLARLRELGPDDGTNAYVSGLVRVLLASDQADPEGSLEPMQRLTANADRHVATAASQWLSHERENAGDPAGARQAANRALALARDDDGPWPRAMAHGLLAQLAMNSGDHAAAVGHARAALPVMRRLGASDDEIQLQVLLVLCAIADGRLADAAAELDRVEQIDESSFTFGGIAFRQICQGELLLAAGDTGAGLAVYREAAKRMREIEFPGIVRTGQEPWALFGEAMALAAHAHYATDAADQAHGQAVFTACRDGALKVFGQDNPRMDYPAAGLLLFALGGWSLLHRTAPAQDALRLLALAHRFAYSQANPTLAWERIATAAEEAAPGVLARLREEYRKCPLPGLQTEARRAVEQLPG